MGDSDDHPEAAGAVIRRLGPVQLPSAPDDRRRHYQNLARSGQGSSRARAAASSRANFAVALDATGSMDALIDGARTNVSEIMHRVCEEAGVPVRIRLYVYRDYDVPNSILECSELTGDPQILAAWLSRIKTFGGGSNGGEAIETALQAIYTADDVAAVLLAGDEPPTPPGDLDARGDNTPSAFVWAERLREKHVPVHTFVVGQRARTLRDFAKLAELSGGRSGRLDGSSEMIELAVMAMLASLGGPDRVRSFMARNALSANAEAFGRLLLTGPTS